jgi:glycosyltransferase involved in cell wall biosynthesis
MFPRVSVIIPAYNAEKTISDLIQSITTQSFSKEKSEIIVVNDCSTDKTLEILTKLQRRYSFRIVSHEVNKGLAATRNTGIRNSSGKILIFIDADMTVGDHYIENHVNFHNNKKVMGVVGGILPGEEIKLDKYQKYLYKAKRGIKKYPLQKPIPYKAFIFGNTSVKRTVIDECGLFDENIKIYGGEDTEFAYRVSQKYSQNIFGTHALTARHHHYRNFDDALKNLQTFAATNIPYIIGKHSSMAKLYGVHFLNREINGSTVFHRIIGTVVSSYTFTYLNKFFYAISPFPLSKIFTRGLMAANLFRGINKGLSK